MFINGKPASAKVNLIVGLTILVSIVITFLINLNTHSRHFFLLSYIFVALEGLLGIQSLWLVVISIANFIRGRALRGVLFLLCAPVLWGILYVLWGAYFFTALTEFEPPVDDYEVRDFDNFKPTYRCHKIDTAKVIAYIQGLKESVRNGEPEGAYLKHLKQNYEENSNYYRVGGIDSFPDFLPDTIARLECGCRVKDTSIMVLRLWDKRNETYLLELKLNGDSILYGDVYPRSFY